MPDKKPKTRLVAIAAHRYTDEEIAFDTKKHAVAFAEEMNASEEGDQGEVWEVRTLPMLRTSEDGLEQHKINQDNLLKEISQKAGV